ncbi:MAG: family 20 glycosylhydrolase [Clostridia bacterium]|nr:family 20 glycosylhydrolase [Clostridia bacterium]
MYIGELTNIKNVTYTHKGTEVPFPPSFGTTWNWKYAYDDAIDVTYTLDGESYLGAVSLDITENAVKKVEVLADGSPAGVYTAETGKLTGGRLDIPVGVKATVIVVRFYTDLRDLNIHQIELLGAHDDGKPLVWPTPKSIEYLDGFVRIKDVVAKNEDPDEVFAAEFLKERLTEKLGDWASNTGITVVVEKCGHKSYDKERYTVKTTKNQITIRAKTRLTLLYGTDTLLQLTGKEGVRRFLADDRPDKEFRGFHAGLPQRHQFEFMRRLFRYVLLPMRYNTLFVQLSGCMRYDSHPEIAEAWQKTVDGYRKGILPTPPHIFMLAMGDILEKEEVLRYVGYARELGMEIIPEVQSLGHVQYITLAHPELAEIEEASVAVEDTRTEDERPAEEYHHCYCPSLEESYRIIFDIIDEVVELLKPERYVHIGHDEVYQIGLCKRCREKDPADLFATHVNRLHDHLAKKGLGTMMWADMLQPPPAADYPTWRAIDQIAKDVVMLDFIWYFNIPRDIEDNLLKKGFRVAVGNLYSSHFPRYRSRITKKGMIGGQISTWLENSEEVYGNNGKLWDVIYLSEMLWNAGGYEERNRRTYTHLLSEHLLSSMRDHLRGKYCPVGYEETSISLPNGRPAPAELLELCPGAIILENQKIAVNGRYDRLIFDHATLHSMPRIVWEPIEKMGDYLIFYADGMVEYVPVKYAENIMAYQTTYAEPMHQEFYRHNGYVGTWFIDPTYRGKDRNGEDLTVGGFVWENPHPEKEIAAIIYHPVETDHCGLILAGLRGCNPR